MKKIILSIFILTFLAACNNASDYDIQEEAVFIGAGTGIDAVPSWLDFSMHVAPHSVTPTSLQLSMINNSQDLSFEHGTVFTIEKHNGGRWEQVPFIDEIFWTLPLFIVSPGITINEDISWEHMHGELDPGLYRIVRNFMQHTPGSSTPSSSQSYIYATFEITQNWQSTHDTWQNEQQELIIAALSRFDGLDLEILSHSPYGLTFSLSNNNPLYSYQIESIFIGWHDNISGIGSSATIEYTVFDSWAIESSTAQKLIDASKNFSPGDNFALTVNWEYAIGHLSASMDRSEYDLYIFELMVDASLVVSQDYANDNFGAITPGAPTTHHRITAQFDISQ